MESVPHSGDIRSGFSIDPTRVLTQKVHNYRSDRWIALKLFSGGSGGCFTWRSVESALHYDDVRSGNSTDTTRVPGQKLHKYRCDRCITLKTFSRVSEGSFTWSSAESVLHFGDVRSGNSTDTTRVLAQKVYKYRSDRWIALKKFSGVSEGYFM